MDLSMLEKSMTMPEMQFFDSHGHTISNIHPVKVFYKSRDLL